MAEAMHSVMDAELIEGTLTFGAREAERRVTGMLKGLKPEGCVLTSAEAITDVKYAWLEVVLPTGETIRPLAEFGGRDDDGMALSFRYLFPKDRVRLNAFGAHYRKQSA